MISTLMSRQVTREAETPPLARNLRPRWSPSLHNPANVKNKRLGSVFTAEPPPLSPPASLCIRQDRIKREQTCFEPDLQSRRSPSQEVQICPLNDTNQPAKKLFQGDFTRGAAKVHVDHSSCDDDKSCRKTKQLCGFINEYCPT